MDLDLVLIEEAPLALRREFEEPIAQGKEEEEEEEEEEGE